MWCHALWPLAINDFRSFPRALADISPEGDKPDSMTYQVQAAIADNSITDNKTLPRRVGQRASSGSSLRASSRQPFAPHVDINTNYYTVD